MGQVSEPLRLLVPVFHEAHLKRAVDQSLIQVDDHADLSGILRLHRRQQWLHLDLEKKKKRHKMSSWSDAPVGWRDGGPTHLGDGAVLLHQQRGVVVDGLGLRRVPAQAAEQVEEEASAPGLLGGRRGGGACGGGGGAKCLRSELAPQKQKQKNLD